MLEISKLFASFENVEQTFDPALDIVTRTLPLRSAILMEAEAGRSQMSVWPSEGQDSQETLASFEGVAQDKELQLTADVEPHLPKVYCDRDRILQVLSNLVGERAWAWLDVPLYGSRG